MRTCALRREKIEQGYVRATQTRLLYCDAQCFARHEKMATLVSERCARKVSWNAQILIAIAALASSLTGVGGSTSGATVQRNAATPSWTKVSVAGKRNFAVRDKGAETAPEDQGDHCRDMTHASNPANSALLAQRWEISVSEKVRGGAERTRTACQARSRYRTGLSRVIHRGNSAL
jgi:hypothetical protein